MSAAIYLRGGRLIICPIYKTSSGGGGLEGEPVVVVDVEEVSAIGANLITALARSKKILGDSDAQEQRKRRSVVRAAGLRSYKQFVLGARYISVGERDGKFVLQPTKNGGSTGPIRGFHFLPERNRLVTTEDPEELGRAVLAAFEDCE
jgi:hypothetical protein